jgi:hypothetical protein
LFGSESAATDCRISVASEGSPKDCCLSNATHGWSSNLEGSLSVAVLVSCLEYRFTESSSRHGWRMAGVSGDGKPCQSVRAVFLVGVWGSLRASTNGSSPSKVSPGVSDELVVGPVMIVSCHCLSSRPLHTRVSLLNATRCTKQHSICLS